MQKQLFKNTISTICLLLIAAPMLIVCINYSGLYFLSFLAFWIMIPGGLFLYALKKHNLECDGKSLHLIYSFLLGAISIIMQFFILHTIGFISLIKYVNPILSLFAIILFFINYKKTPQKAINLKQNINLLGEHLPIIITLLIAVYMCAFTMNFYAPSAESIKYQDYTWHIGNIAQLASNNPFENIRVAGVEFKYHYFNTLFYAIEKIIFDIPAWTIFTQHQIFIIPTLITLSFYNLYNKISSNKWAIALMTLFTFTGFTITSSYGDFLYHWSSNINAVGIGSVIICSLFLSIKPLLQEKTQLNKKTFSHIILFLLFLFYASGNKGPYGAIAILAICCFIIMQLLRKKKPSATILILFITSLISFSVLYSILLSNGADSFFGGTFFTGILASVTRVPLFSELRSIPGSRIFLFLPSLILTLTLTFIPLVLCAIDSILYTFRKKELSPEFIYAAFITVIGITAYYTFSISGIGQVYFLFCATPFIGYLAFSKIVELTKTRPNLRKVSIVLTLCFSVICFYKNIYFTATAFSLSAMQNYFSMQAPEIDLSITQKFEGYEFLKTHVQDNRITISNRHSPDETKSEVFHFISAFSEKHCYFEGYQYAQNLGYTESAERLETVQNFFSNNLTTTEKHAFALAENIGYVFIFAENEYPTIHPETGKFFEEIFANDAVTIYEVLV